MVKYYSDYQYEVWTKYTIMATKNIHQDPDIRGGYVPGKHRECWGIISMGNGGIGSGDFPTCEKSPNVEENLAKMLWK